MSRRRSARSKQIDAAVAAIRGALEPGAIVGMYLYGSIVAGGLRADSDLDLFVLTRRSLESREKRRLIESLRPISRRSARPRAWRPLDVTVVNQAGVQLWHYPPQFELQYGEWLTDDDLEAQADRGSSESADLAVLITMVRTASEPLVGPPAVQALAAVPHADLIRAIRDEVPALLSDLEDDTRNVLLTLTRGWATVAVGEIRSKDVAAEWALVQLPPEHQPAIAHARDLYLHGGSGEWNNRMDEARAVASHLAARIAEGDQHARNAVN